MLLVELHVYCLFFLMSIFLIIELLYNTCTVCVVLFCYFVYYICTMCIYYRMDGPVLTVHHGKGI